MSLLINTNVSAVFAQKYISRNQSRLRGNFEKLSSGMRITKAADDAAGLAISEAMRADIRSLHQATRNINDGVSVVQTAEGALGEVSNILARMRELAVESASDVLQPTERAYIGTEFTELQTEIDRIANVTEFNGLALADGTTVSIDVQAGIQNTANDRVTINLQDGRAATLGVDAAAANLGTALSSQTAITTIDSALDVVNNSRAIYGAVQNSLTTASRNLETYTENLVDAESRIRDVDFAMETTDFARNQIFQQAGTTVLAQANQSPQSAMALLQG